MDVHEDGTLGDDVQLIKPATTIKAINGQPGRVGGYLVVWGSPQQRDLQGEYFTPETDLGLDWYSQRPALYHHGLDPDMEATVVGVIDTLKTDNIGLWAEARLDINGDLQPVKMLTTDKDVNRWLRAQRQNRQRYAQAVMQLVDQGALGWSSGSLPHLTDVAADGQIKRWPIVEGSLTPSPAEPRHTDIHSIKSLPQPPEMKQYVFTIKCAYAALGQDPARLLPDSEEGDATSEEPPAKENAAKTADAVDTDQSTTRTFKMDMQTIVQQVLAGLLAARPEWQLTPEEQTALIQQILASMSAPAEQPVEDGMMSVALQQAAGKAISVLTAHFNEKAQKAAAHQTMLQTAVKGAIATVPAQPVAQFTGGQNGQPQSNRQFVNQLTVKTKFGELNAEDMSYLYGLRKKFNAARGLGAVAFEDAEEQQKFLREMADKAGKSYEAGQIKFGDQKETGAAIKSINAIKSDELDYSTQASYGDEWVPDLWASQIWNKFRMEAVIAPLFRVIEMPSDPFELPIESTDPTVYYVPETKNEADLTISGSGNPTPDSKIGSGKVQLASKKLSLRVGFSEEMVEDSIIPIISMYREQAQKTLILSIDAALLNGDTAAANNVNLDGGTPATTAVYKAFDGIRKLALVTASPVNAVDMGGIAPTIAKIRQARFTMPAARASLPGKIAYITHGELYAKLLSLSEVITADKFGPNATIVTGQLGNLDGSKLLLTDQLTLTASNGKISNTGGNNTFGELVGVHTDSFVVGYRRKVNVNVDRIPATDSYQLSANVRIAFVSIDSEGAFVLYDILV